MYFQTKINDELLQQAVKRAVSDFIKQNKAFTAYTITLALQDEVGKNVSILHDVVRRNVHEIMNGLLDSSLYKSKTIYPNGKDAVIEYFPSTEWEDIKTEDKDFCLTVNKLDSSAIEYIEYSGNTDKGNLGIIFHNAGTIVRYNNVPFDIFQEFLGSNSLGSFYHNNIKGKYAQ